MAFSDTMGRSFGGSPEDLMQALLGNVGNLQNLSKAAEDVKDRYKEMAKALNKLNTNFLPEFEKTIRDLNGAIKQMGNGGGKKKSGKDPVEARLEDIYDVMSQLYFCLCKSDRPSKNQKGVIAYEQKMSQRLEKEKKKSTGVSGAVGGGGGKKGGGGGGTSGGGGGEWEFDPDTGRFEKKFGKLSGKVLGLASTFRQNMEHAMFGFEEKGTLATYLMEGSLTELIKKENEFAVLAKQAAYEVAGITSETKSLQQEYLNIGKVVNETGMSRTKYQQQFLENMRAGIKDTKTLQGITKQTLATEYQLGMKAGELTEHFRSMTLSGKTNLAQTAEMGRGMQQVARNTGLTGEHLKKAIGASEQFVENLKNAATLTAAAANNVLEVVANAQKLGVSKAATELLNNATSSANLILGASQQTQALLYNAAGQMGKINELQMGVLTRSKKGIKDLGDGMEKVLQQFGVDSLEAVESLPDDIKMQLNIQLKTAFGMELGEFQRTAEAFKEAGKGLSDRLADINKKRQLNLTLEEKTALAQQERALKTNAALSVLTGLSEAAKGTKSMDEALKKFDARAGEFSADVKAFGGDIGSSKEMAASSLMEATKNLNQELAKVGKGPVAVSQEEIAKALEGGPEQLNLIMERINKANAELATAQKAATDPVTQTAQTLEQYNDYFRNTFAGPMLEMTKQMLGNSGAMAIAIGLLGSQGLLFGAGIKNKLEGFFDKKDDGGSNEPSLVSKLFGKAKEWFTGKKGGGGGAEAGAAPAEKAGSIPCPEMPDFKALELSWEDLKKHLGTVARGLLGIVSVVAMAGLAILAIAAVTGTVMGALAIDPLQVALQVTTLFLGLAIIAVEVALAFKALEEASDQWNKIVDAKKLPKILAYGAGLMIISMAIIALSAGLLYLAQKLTFGLDADTAMKIALDTNAVIFGMISVIGTIMIGALALMGLSLGVVKLMGLLKVGWWAVGIAVVALPFIAAIVLGLAIALLKFSQKMLDATGLDLATIQDIVLRTNLIVWGTTALISGLLAASLAVMGVGLILGPLFATKVGWIALAAGIGSILAMATIMKLIVDAIGEFVESFEDVDLKDFKENAEKAITFLDVTNSILLRLVPLFALVIAGGAIAIALAAATGGVQNAAIAFAAGAWAMAVILPVVATALTTLAAVIVEFVTGVVNAFNIDPAKLQADVAKFEALMNAVNTILWKLVPLFGLIMGMGAALGALVALTGWMGPAIIAGLAVLGGLIAAALPALVGFIVQVGTSIVQAAAAASGMSMDEKKITETVSKIELMANTLQRLAAAVATISKNAASAAATFAAAAINVNQAASALSAMLPAMQQYIFMVQQYIKMLNSFSPEQLLQLATKFEYIAKFSIALNKSMYAIDQAAIGATVGVVALPMLVVAMSRLENSLTEFLKTMSRISMRVYRFSMMMDPETLAKSFDQITGMSENVVKFMKAMRKFSLKKVVSQSITTWMTKGMVEKNLKSMLEEMKNIVTVVKTAGFNRADLIMANEVFKIIGEFGENVSKSVDGMKKTIDTLSPKGWFGQNIEIADSTVVKTNMNKLIDLYLTIIDDVALKSENQTFIENGERASQFMIEMARTMESLEKSMTVFTKVAQMVLNNTESGWFWWITGGSIVDRLAEEKDVAGKRLNMFGALLETMLGSFNQVVTETLKHKDTAARASAANTVLEVVAKTLEEFTVQAQKVADKLVPFFADGWFSDGSGKQLADSHGRISDGMKGIFLSLNAVKETMANVDITGLNSAAGQLKSTAAAIEQLAIGMNQFTDILYKFNDNFKKAPAYAWLRDNSIYNQYFDAFDNLKYVGIMGGHIIASLQNGFASGFEGDPAAIIAAMNNNVKLIAETPPGIAKAIEAFSSIANMSIPDESALEKIKNLGEAMKRFLTAFGGMVNAIAKHEIFATADFAGAKQKLTTVASIIDPLADSIKKFMEYAMFQSTLSYGIFGEQNTKPLEMAAGGIGKFINAMGGIVKAVNESGGNWLGSYKDTVTRLKNLQDIVMPIKTLLEFFSQQLGPLATASEGEWSLADKVGQNAESISKAIESVGKMVSGIKVAASSVPDAKGVEEILGRINAISTMADAVKKTLESLHAIMTVMTNSEALGNKSLIDSVHEMTKKSGLDGKDNPIVEIFKFMSQQIFAPLMKLPFDEFGSINSEDIEEGAKILKGMAAGMVAVKDLINAANTTMTNIAVIGTAKTNNPPSAQQLEQSGTKLGLLLRSMRFAMPGIKTMFGFMGEMIDALFDAKTGAFRNYDAEDVEDASKILKSMGEIFKTISGDGTNKGLIAAMNAAQMEIAGTVADTQGNNFQVGTWTEKAKANFAQMANLTNFIRWVAPFLGEIVNVVHTSIPFGPDDVADAGKIVSGIGSMIEGLPKIMETVRESLPKMIKSNQGINSTLAAQTQNLPKQKAILATIFENTAIFLSGIVDPILDNFDSAQDVQTAAGIVPAMISMADTIANNGPQLVQAAQSIINMPAIGVIDPRKALGFASLFNILAMFSASLLQSNIDGITNDLTSATEKISGVDQALQGLIKALSGLGSSMVDLGRMGTALQGGVNVSANVQASTSPSPEAGRRQVARTVEMAGVSSATLSAAAENNIEHIATATMATASRLSTVIDVLNSINSKYSADSGEAVASSASGSSSSALDATTLADSDATGTAAFGIY